MPREDLLTTDKEKARAKAEIHRFLTRLAVFAALCGVLFGVVFGLAVVPGSTMVPRLYGGDLVLFSRFERGTAAGQVVLYRQDGTLHLGRIAARGGDTVTVTDTGALIINGSTVAEPDITTPTQPVEGGPDYPVTPRGGRAFPAVRCPHHGGGTAASTAPSHSGKCWARPWPPCAAAGCKPCCNPSESNINPYWKRGTTYEGHLHFPRQIRQIYRCHRCGLPCWQVPQRPACWPRITPPS